MRLIVCAGNGEKFGFASAIGVGMVQSAINLTQILSKKLPNEIIFVGTAGLYSEGEILGIYESKTAVNHEISELFGYSYSPLKTALVSYETEKKNIVNSSNFITSNSEISAKFAALGYRLENMEFHSVLSVAKHFKIPAYGIFCATNFCNETAHEDFIKNHAAAKIQLEKYLKSKGLA